MDLHLLSETSRVSSTNTVSEFRGIANFLPLTEKQDDEKFGAQNGCMAIEKKLPYKWPLALDVFKRQYDAYMSGHLLAFQADYFEKTDVGQTFQVKLLGKVGYFTTDSKNIESILLTRFEGKTLCDA